MKKILFIAGTRPEAIKLAPLYLQMLGHQRLQPQFCATGQHSDLMTAALDVFGIRPDALLAGMAPGQPLSAVAGRLLENVGREIAARRPDLVIVQGDTASAWAGAWASFLQKTPVLHVEAGLRTSDPANPFPEEANRRAVSLVATWHAAPTPAARENLLNEGISPRQIAVTGNTAIDALLMVKNRLSPELTTHPAGQRRILITCHRRENFGDKMIRICQGIQRIAADYPDAELRWVLHPNPEAAQPARELLSSLPNVRLLEPLSYRDFIAEMLQSYFLISDSGGLQEEGPALGRPVLVTREVTERPEAVAIGANQLVGTDADAIQSAAGRLMTDEDAYHRMATAGSPYGDGMASQRICEWLEAQL